MTGNPVYDEIEDELIRCVEAGAKLPEEFTINLDSSEYLALLSSGEGLVDQLGRRITSTTTRLVLMILGHRITFRSDTDPDPFDPNV